MQINSLIDRENCSDDIEKFGEEQCSDDEGQFGEDRWSEDVKNVNNENDLDEVVC